MDRDPAPTLALAALREVDRDNHTRLEDRCTELLATLMLLHEEVLCAVTDLFGISRDPEVSLRPQTQVRTGRGRQHVDLQIGSESESELTPVAWIEVKVFSLESGVTQFQNYSTEANAKNASFHVLCHEMWCARLKDAHPQVMIRTWGELAERLRSVAGLSYSPISEEAIEPSERAVVADIAQFLYYLQDQGVITMSEPVTQDDLDRFDRWQIALWNVFNLWERVFDVISTDFPEQDWEARRIKPQRSNPFNWRRLTPESRPDDWIEWWWGAFYPAGSETWCIELSLASRAFWQDPPHEHPVLAWGITQHAKDSDLELRLEKVTQQFEELVPVFVENDDAEARWYGAVPLNQVVGQSPDVQLEKLVNEIWEPRVFTLREALQAAGVWPEPQKLVQQSS